MPWETISASGSTPSASARSALMTTSAAAPSEICEALPAVIVPSGPNAGGSWASESGVVSGRMPSSASTTETAPRRPVTSTAAISSADRPEALALAARSCERAAQASCRSRAIPSDSFTSSDDSPMCWPVNVDQRPSWIIASTISPSPSRSPQRARGMT